MQADRFWAKVEKTDGCWLWQGTTSEKGYGRVLVPTQLKEPGKRRHRVWRAAHRHAWIIEGRELPEEMVLHHKCENPQCVNPDHLEPVTRGEHLLIHPRFTATWQVVKTHCPQGHPYEGENLHIGTRGERYCRTCSRNHARRYRQQRIAQRQSRLDGDLTARKGAA